mgnify:CR=1 FL=1
MPTRKVSNRGGNIIGHHPSLKVGRMIAFESTIERDFIYLLDYDPDVKTFEEQPFIIEYEWAGKIHRYTPDFHVVRCSSDPVVECKPLNHVNDEDNQRKFYAARRWCLESGREFKVETEVAIRSGSRLKNVVKLAQFARHYVEPGYCRLILGVLGEESISILDLMHRISAEQPNAVLFAIYHLAYHHILEMNIDCAPIGFNTLVKCGTC